MAKQAGDVYTLELIDKPKRGRPRKADALTAAQRAKRYRDKKRAKKKAFGIQKTTIMFRGPNGETWTGRGQVPKWLQVLEASGRRRVEFLAWN